MQNYREISSSLGVVNFWFVFWFKNKNVCIFKIYEKGFKLCITIANRIMNERVCSYLLVFR